MNFFKEQEIARQKLGLFQRLFYLTIVSTAFCTAVSLFIIQGLVAPDIENIATFWVSSLFWWIFALTVVFILSMSQLKLFKLRRGGDYIAKLAGATPLPVHLLDVRHKRLKNVVEEMSIASGIVPPKIYIMPNEPCINAFAAGFSTHDAVIGISDGCLNKLTREELQGVVAHEIGHIVNGDMKLNLQLIGYLFGLMGISEVGRFLMRQRSNRKGASLFPYGLVIFLIGIVGYFLGLLLKLRISRGQEFGADAKAVQFTRNPEGIGGALKKILATTHEFKIVAAKSHELEHLYLFYPKKSMDLLATHPPLPSRIKKICPNFNVKDYRLREEKQFRNLMNSDLSSTITKSFANETMLSPTSVGSETEAKDELKERALQFFKVISSIDDEMNAPDQLIREMDLLLGSLRSLNLDESKALIKKIKIIILADKIIIPRETLCFTLFKETLIPRKKAPSNRLGLIKARQQVLTMLSFLASVSSDNKASKEESFRLGMNLIYPGVSVEMDFKIPVNKIIDAFELSKDLIPLAKSRLLEACLIVIEHEKSKNFNKGVFLRVLCQVMGVPIET